MLTKTAEKDFRAAKQWSLNRWGKALTKRYFEDLHAGAEWLAENCQKVSTKQHMGDLQGLAVHAIREHYLVYVPWGEQKIVIVALIRQTRDVPKILKENAFVFRRELADLDSN